MYYLVTLVIDDVNQCPAILDAWESAGVGGVTILASTGLQRMRRLGLRDDLPLMPSLRSLMQGRPEEHRTVFSLVEGEAMVERLIRITEDVLGSLDNPDTGILFATPVSHVVGLQRRSDRGPQ